MVIEKDGSHYDRFRHRIMFPIRNSSGQVIGFGGRVLDDSKPKYLNSPDTPLFDKGKNLYGLYEARAAVKEAGRILVVEGYMDVVALAQFGIGYCVAALGTATTAEHVKILMRQTDSIYFCFDGDAAGRKAAWRALENALPQLKDGKSLHFLFLPEGHDPDSYVREHGRERFEDMLLHQSKPLSAYFWDALTAKLDLRSQEGKAELVKNATPLLTQITAPALAFLLKQELSNLVGIDPANLAHLMGQEAPKRHVAQQRYTLPRQTFRQPQMLSLAQQQIRRLLINPQWATYIDLPDHLELDADLACLSVMAAHVRRSPSPLSSAGLMEAMRNTPYYGNISRIMQSGTDSAHFEGDGESDALNFQSGMQKLMNALKTQQVEALKRKRIEHGLSDDETKLLLELLRHPPADGTT